MKQLGLIGYPLGHSFSKKYFSEKFLREGIPGWQYELYPLESIEALPALLRGTPDLVGLNVTIPYKEAVLRYCQSLHPTAERIGAVNTLVVDGEQLTGYNTDYVGFKSSLESWVGVSLAGMQALILGTGGAAKAVQIALEDLGVPYRYVSRRRSESAMSYEQVTPEVLSQHTLIVNTTPLGMSPHTEVAPAIPYAHLSASHYLYDLVYNPERTEFMRQGEQRGAQVKNGLDMLVGQAEAAWEIWRQR